MNRKGYDEQTWFTFSYSPVRDESGTVAGMFCAFSETTQKVLAERALRESEGRLRALVAASSYALYRMSPDWSQMLALEGQGFIADTSSPSGAWLGDYIHPDDQAHVTAAIQRAIATKEHVRAGASRAARRRHARMDAVEGRPAPRCQRRHHRVVRRGERRDGAQECRGGAPRTERDARAPRDRGARRAEDPGRYRRRRPTRSSRSSTSTIGGWPSTAPRPTSSSGSSAFVRKPATTCSICWRRSPTISAT